jgi:hypothetical protein
MLSEYGTSKQKAALSPGLLWQYTIHSSTQFSKVQTYLYTLQLAQCNHGKFTTDMFLTHEDISTTPRWVVAQNVTRLHETLEISVPVVPYRRPTQTAIRAVLHIITLIRRHCSPFRQHYVNVSVKAKLSLRLIRPHTMKAYRKQRNSSTLS